ncbi:four helix bundle protein [Perlabentimonas gracilis]|uniref:four helix bundle protein n=1 Tax=Perlabentimonas gracilis TaxID=2715279 RepID=UPI0014087AE2|nr:four helix bundle protein [Perlabentimonas gracilis]NHB70293.1 four helix bundle protein [Perlabentimonas gracilis]
MTINSFEDLDIWKDARELAKVIRLLTKREPFSKDFKLCNQINSSAGSVMDNIAEGFERDGHKEFIQFLYIAKPSNGETRSQSYRAFDAKFISEEELNDILSRTQSLKIKIISLINYLKKSTFKGNKFKP